MNYKRVMVFGAHADDEIRMAGTIAKMANAGVRVVIVTMTNGCEGYPRIDMKDTIVELRRQEAAECDKVMGVARRVIFDIPDMGLNTHIISVEARWHAGEPVAAELGEPWYPPHLYYYKGLLGNELPSIVIDVTQTGEKVAEALATQVSQHTLFRRTKENFLAEAESIRKNRPHRTERFWITAQVTTNDFLPIP
jgi:LmbE family N-acetylglucosaminyl deacetylase